MTRWYAKAAPPRRSLSATLNRRPVLLTSSACARAAAPSSVISERVDEWQRDNWSVYAPHDALPHVGAAPERLRWRCPTFEEHRERRGGCGYLRFARP